MSKEQKQELVPITQTISALARIDEIRDVVAANMRGRQAGALDLERIRIGRGGSTLFTVMDSVTGEEKAFPKMQVVIPHYQPQRIYWGRAYGSTEGGPPDCSSDDMLWGNGDPKGTGERGRHECRLCPNDVWGSAVDEKGNPRNGKACRETILMFLLRLDGNQGLFPSLFIMPTGSLRHFNTYMMALSSRGLPYSRVVHELSQEGAKAATGQAYAQLRMKMVRELTADEAGAVQGYAEAMSPVVASMKAGAGDLRE